MYQQYSEQTIFVNVEVNKTFVYKPFFGNPILYKKIPVKTLAGLKYNSEQVKPGLKQYEWFDQDTPVKVMR